jgi:hypothetical protein
MTAASFMPMSKIKSIAALSLLTLLWLVVWAFIALYAASLYSSVFSYSSIRASFSQCLHINLFRTGLYLVFFYGQLLIFKAVAGGQSGLVDYFKIPFIIDSIRINLTQLKELKTQPARTNIKLLIKNLIWVSYWYFISFSIYWSSASHFMWDCDDGDLECTCNNLPYLLPAFLGTLIVGCLFITYINYQKMLNESQTSNLKEAL